MRVSGRVGSAVLMSVLVGCGSNNGLKPDASGSGGISAGTGGSSAGAGGNVSAGAGGAGGLSGTGGSGGPPTCVAGTAPGTRIALQSATATFSQTATGPFSVKWTIDGVTSDDLGWAAASADNSVAAATAAMETQADTPAYPVGTRLAFVLVHNYTGGPHALGRFRLSVTTSDRAQFADGNDGSATPGNVGPDNIWTPLTPTSVCGFDNVTMSIRDDGSVLVTPNAFIPMAYTIIADTALTGITGVRIETLKDPSLPFSGPGLQSTNGNFVLTEFQMYAGAR